MSECAKNRIWSFLVNIIGVHLHLLIRHHGEHVGDVWGVLVLVGVYLFVAEGFLLLVEKGREIVDVEVEGGLDEAEVVAGALVVNGELRLEGLLLRVEHLLLELKLLGDEELVHDVAHHAVVPLVVLWLLRLFLEELGGEAEVGVVLVLLNLVLHLEQLNGHSTHLLVLLGHHVVLGQVHLPRRDHELLQHRIRVFEVLRLLQLLLVHPVLPVAYTHSSTLPYFLSSSDPPPSAVSLCGARTG